MTKSFEELQEETELSDSELHLAQGIYFGFPMCCIFQWIQEDEEGIMQYEKRELDFGTMNIYKTMEVITKGNPFVPCDKCIKKIAFMPQRIIKIILFLILILLFSLTFALAGQVTDNNNGNAGDILISTGKNIGQNSEGTWVNSSTFKGDKGKDGIDGINGNDGQRGERGYIGKGLKNQYKSGIEVVIADTRKTEWIFYANYDYNNQNTESGIKIKIKLGKSYLEKRIEELERRLK